MIDIIKIIIESNTLNFIIVFLILSIIVYKLNIGKKIDIMKTEIKNYVDESTNEKETAEKELEKINNTVKKLPDEINKIKNSAKNSVESFSKKIEAEIKEKMLDIDNNANRIMNYETKKFKSKLSGILSEASITLAQDNAINQLENTPELHNKYIYEAIDEIDRINL